jgi:osmotically-inducible protein OsmY
MVGYSEIAARVRTALTQDPRTAGVSIEVIDENGVITLRGKVNLPRLQSPLDPPLMSWSARA